MDTPPFADLAKTYRLKKFAEMRMNDDFSCSVTILNEQIADARKGIYFWITNDRIIRIGSSKDFLRKRIQGAARWLELRLTDTVGTKNPERRKKELADAIRWKNLLHGTDAHAEIWGRSGTVVRTPIGEVNCYLAEENILLQRHRPPFNNSHFR